MGRKRKEEKKKINVVVGGKAVAVTLYPPTPRRTSWFAYWTGLSFAKSTGQRDFDQAVIAVQNMLQNGGQRTNLADAVLSDDEFDEIQRRHYGKKKDPDAMARAERSLQSCMEAIAAFRLVTGLKPITTATPDDCERFQHEALELPRNWRSKYPKSKQEVETLSPNTVVKWTVALQAAFERAVRSSGRKCVRGVVPEEKLLAENPWRMFSRIEGRKKKIRQFNADELVSFVDWLEGEWSDITVAPLVAKVFLWSWGRRSEVTGLRWDDLRKVGGEIHFEVIGKWAIDKWFRIPEPLYRDLLAIRTASPFVFAVYNDQLRQMYQRSDRPWLADNVNAEFDPVNLGYWFYERVKDWSQTCPGGPACVHIFRKTSLQYARSGEDVNRQVAADARLGEGVMMTNYVKETDEEMRQKSNRTYRRIAASLPPAVAKRYGYEEATPKSLRDQLKAAVEAENWDLAQRLTAELAQRDRQAG
jgi:integrase